MAVQDIRERCEKNDPPNTPGDFIVALATGLVERMSPVLQDFDEEIDELEGLHDNGDLRGLRPRLTAARQKMIPLRRYLSPQRDAMAQLVLTKTTWLSEWHVGRLRETADRITRFVEDLDSARERTAVIQDFVANSLAERMNQIMLLLSIVAAIFLPLSLLTGLLGINVGGMPGAKDDNAFWIVTFGLVVLGLAEIALFKKLKWI